MLNKRIFILLIVLLPIMMNCKTGSSTSRQSTAEANAAAKQNEDRAKYYDAVKQHDKDQTKETRKRMKEIKKKSNASHIEHKQFFLWRWLSRKPKPCTPQPTN